MIRLRRLLTVREFGRFMNCVKRILAQHDPEILKSWLKVANKVGSVEEFLEKTIESVSKQKTPLPAHHDVKAFYRCSTLLPKRKTFCSFAR